jgi:hypothetical protein
MQELRSQEAKKVHLHVNYFVAGFSERARDYSGEGRLEKHLLRSQRTCDISRIPEDQKRESSI